MKKKKIVQKKSVRRAHAKQTAPKEDFNYRRIILISGTFVVLLFLFVFLSGRTIKREVAGLSIARGMFNQAAVSWKPVNGAVAYNIYYGQSGNPLNNAVRNIPAYITTYTISYLKKNTAYQYRVSALQYDNKHELKEFWFSPVLYVNNETGM